MNGWMYGALVDDIDINIVTSKILILLNHFVCKWSPRTSRLQILLCINRKYTIMNANLELINTKIFSFYLSTTYLRFCHFHLKFLHWKLTTINIIPLYIKKNKISIMQDSCPVCCSVNLTLYRILACIPNCQRIFIQITLLRPINFHVSDKNCFAIKSCQS